MGKLFRLYKDSSHSGSLLDDVEEQTSDLGRHTKNPEYTADEITQARNEVGAWVRDLKAELKHQEASRARLWKIRQELKLWSLW